MKRFLLVLLFVPFLLSGCNFMNEEDDFTTGDYIYIEKTDGTLIKSRYVTCNPIIEWESNQYVMVAIGGFLPETFKTGIERYSLELNSGVRVAFSEYTNKLVVAVGVDGGIIVAEKIFNVDLSNISKFDLHVHSDKTITLENFTYL